MKKPELILPAGSLEKLGYAFAYGADAVYAGLPDISLRAQNNDFDVESLKSAIHAAHWQNKKLYIAVNIFAHEHDIKRAERFIREISEWSPDGFIISDPGILSLIRRSQITIPLHLSTQANTTNSESARFWRDQGIDRIILARELRYPEIAKICEKTDGIELELFIHGALCISYSGRCLLSSFLTGRDANRGECAGTCRWRYSLVEETREDERFEIQEDRRGTYILNSKDLCLLQKIPLLKKLKIDGYKIEGRTKNIFYVSIVARAYRKVIDDIFTHGRKEVDRESLELLDLIDSHGYTCGFLFQNGEVMQDYSEGSIRKQSIVGLIKEYSGNNIWVAVKNPLSVGEDVIGISPRQILPFNILEITDNGKQIDTAYGAKHQFVRASIDRTLTDVGWKFGILVKK